MRCTHRPVHARLLAACCVLVAAAAARSQQEPQPPQPAREARQPRQDPATPATPTTPVAPPATPLPAAGQQAPGDDAARQAPADAEALFAAFAKVTGLEARFEEEKHLPLLALPLKSQGRLYYMRPGYLARVVEQPERSEVRITPSELRASGPDGEEVIDLRQSPEVRLFVTSLVRVFSGDAAALQRSYDVAFARSADDPGAWTLTLAPRAAPLTKMIEALRLRGRGYAVQAIEVDEPKGGRSVTRILEVDRERRFSEDEQRRLFGT